MEDYERMQKQINEILPKYAMLADFRERNATLLRQLSQKGHEVAQLKSEMYQSVQDCKDYKIK